MFLHYALIRPETSDLNLLLWQAHYDKWKKVAFVCSAATLIFGYVRMYGSSEATL